MHGKSVTKDEGGTVEESETRFQGNRRRIFLSLCRDLPTTAIGKYTDNRRTEIKAPESTGRIPQVLENTLTKRPF
jgi:hypothetical protein